MPTPFDALPVTPANHFRLHFYAAVSQVLAAVAPRLPASDVLRERVHTLAGYRDDLLACGVPLDAPARVPGWWRDAVRAWEAQSDAFLPIRAVREALAADHDALVITFVTGLIEEDARFGALFELLNDGPSQPRATTGLLGGCWREADDAVDVRGHLRSLVHGGLLRPVAADVPRLHRAFEVPGAVWDALRGERHAHPAPWVRFAEPAAALEFGDVVVAPRLRAALARVPPLLRSGDARAVILRGPLHNGRRTLLASLARAIGRGVLELRDVPKPDDPRWAEAGLLAVALQAMPVVSCDPAPGETVDISRPPAVDGPVGVVTSRAGAIGGTIVDAAITFAVDVPTPAERRQHWRRALGETGSAALDAIVDRFRLTSGHVHRAAALARAQAALAGTASVRVEEVGRAARLLGAEALDALATPVPATGDWTQLAAREDTLRDLLDLELRCRHRERIPPALGSAGGAACGVRALFRGPSGTGKTLAARILAAVLEKDLYRVDLSAIVNKYIGETEKNLNRLLSRAEELDVVLLFDEGDALLTGRTGVSNANDRYANLETNYLLQRLEVFDGILIVTTNAAERIDAAFERRMDVMVHFQPAQAAERWDLWQLHLPAGHAVDLDFLNDVASRCTLSGGQVRNAVLHASLLALQGGRPIDTPLLDLAIRREYRKSGAVCPLRASGAFVPGA